jgi:hypothetical protein
MRPDGVDDMQRRTVLAEREITHSRGANWMSGLHALSRLPMSLINIAATVSVRNVSLLLWLAL